MLVIAGLMVGVTMALYAGLGRAGVRHSSPDHAARDEGERDEQNYQPPQQRLHGKDANLLLRAGQRGNRQSPCGGTAGRRQVDRRESARKAAGKRSGWTLFRPEGALRARRAVSHRVGYE